MIKDHTHSNLNDPANPANAGKKPQSAAADKFQNITRSDMENAIETALDVLQRNRSIDNIENAAQTGLNETLANKDTDDEIKESEEETFKQAIIKALENEIPDEFEYELTYREDQGIMLDVITGCTACGQDKIFNGSYSEYAQWVSYDETKDGVSQCGIDDAHNMAVKKLSCGTCGKTLIDRDSIS